MYFAKPSETDDAYPQFVHFLLLRSEFCSLKNLLELIHETSQYFPQLNHNRLEALLQ